MTDDEKRELITRATKVGTNDVVANPRRYWGLIRELADALEGTLTEPEWEYGVKVTKTLPGDKAWLGGVYGVGTKDEALLAEHHNGGNETCIVRRRKAGPWEAGTDDRD